MWPRQWARCPRHWAHFGHRARNALALPAAGHPAQLSRVARPPAHMGGPPPPGLGEEAGGAGEVAATAGRRTWGRRSRAAALVLPLGPMQGPVSGTGTSLVLAQITRTRLLAQITRTRLGSCANLHVPVLDGVNGRLLSGPHAPLFRPRICVLKPVPSRSGRAPPSPGRDSGLWSPGRLPRCRPRDSDSDRLARDRTRPAPGQYASRSLAAGTRSASAASLPRGPTAGRRSQAPRGTRQQGPPAAPRPSGSASAPAHARLLPLGGRGPLRRGGGEASLLRASGAARPLPAGSPRAGSSLPAALVGGGAAKRRSSPAPWAWGGRGGGSPNAR